jgi:hypothetical protein
MILIIVEMSFIRTWLVWVDAYIRRGRISSNSVRDSSGEVDHIAQVSYPPPFAGVQLIQARRPRK